jgi:hypothetical protein
MSSSATIRGWVITSMLLCLAPGWYMILN